MLLYKFRSFDELEYLLDILVKERLYCCEYRRLNDPFEGMFYSIYYRGYVPGLALTASRPLDELKTQSVDDLLVEAKEKHVCSLSSDFSDVRLWSLYAGGHTGVALEIDFSGIESDVKRVTYLSELPEYGMTLLTNPAASDVLTKKTKHWEYENEYRIIGESQYYPIPGRIRRILAGPRARPERLELLHRVTNERVEIVETRLDFKTITVGT